MKSMLAAAVMGLATIFAVPAITPAAEEAKKEQPLPLKPARNVDFTTTEGTWLSLDVSPDGKNIVFELVGDLYAIPFSGGEAHKLTSGMGFNSQPRYSPDGKKIAFLSDRGGAENVWIADADGSNPKQLSQDQQSEFASPVWTPDGNYVIASRFTQFPIGASELWMYHVKGGAGVQVTKSKARPDTPGSAMRPEISPDGNLLVYATRVETETGLRIRDLKNGEEHWLKYPVQRDDQESLFTRDFLPNYAF